MLGFIRIVRMFLCLLMSFTSVLAPARQADSLKRLLQTTTSYDDRIALLGELSDYYSYRDSTKALDYAFQIKHIAEKHNDMRGIGIAYYRIGGVYFELRHADSAINAYETAEKFLRADTSQLGQLTLAKVWHNHGALYQWKGDADTYLDMILNRAIPIQERMGDQMGMGRNFYNIGMIFQNAKEYERAIHYYRRSIEALHAYPGVPELPDAHIKLAETLMAAGLRQANQRTPILQALDIADSLLHRYPDAYSRIYYLNAKGIYAESVENDLDRALGFYQQGYTLAQQVDIPRQASASLSRCYNIYNMQGKHLTALETAQRIYTDYRDFLTPQDRLTQLRNMAHSHRQLGDIEAAYRINEEASVLNDSLHMAEMAVKIHSLEQRFEAKEKEAKIMQLNQQMQTQRLRAQRNQIWTIFLGAATLLVVGISVAGYNIFRKKQLISRQQAELLEQNLEKMKQDQHISIFGAMLEGQEQERKRLAIDLHDGLGGALSSIKLKLSKTLQGSNGQASNSDLPAIVNQLDNSIGELRRIARNMMPETLLKYGLAAALRDFCKGLENDAVKITFQAYGLNNEIPQTVQIMVYRIVQELVTNALKHAYASHILAQCLQDGHQLSITVEDDGQGLDTEAVAMASGMGLSNVKNRVAYLGGKLDIQSIPNVGTTINVELAYHDE